VSRTDRCGGRHRYGNQGQVTLPDSGKGRQLRQHHDQQRGNRPDQQRDNHSRPLRPLDSPFYSDQLVAGLSDSRPSLGVHAAHPETADRAFVRQGTLHITPVFYEARPPARHRRAAWRRPGQPPLPFRKQYLRLGRPPVKIRKPSPAASWDGQDGPIPDLCYRSDPTVSIMARYGLRKGRFCASEIPR